MIWKKFDSIAF